MVKVINRYQPVRSNISSKVIYFMKKYDHLLSGCLATNKKELAEYIRQHYWYLLTDEQKIALSFRPSKIRNHGLAFFNKLFLVGLEKYLLQFDTGK